MRRLLLLAVVGGLAACSGGGGEAVPTTTQERHVITGTFTLQGTEGDDFVDIGDSCSGTGGYDDVEPGLQVTVSDQAGTVIGNGALGDGETISEGCQFRFELNSVPLATFYRVEVGRRGQLSYSLDQMKQASWSVELTLGN
jgi:hypothetical protein